MPLNHSAGALEGLMKCFRASVHHVTRSRGVVVKGLACCGDVSLVAEDVYSARLSRGSSMWAHTNHNFFLCQRS